MPQLRRRQHSDAGASTGAWPTADGVAQEAAIASEVAEPVAKVHVASQWTLVWWRFRKSPLAVLGLVMVIAIYLTALFADFIAPFQTTDFNSQYTYAPPQRLHFFKDGWDFAPHVTGYSVEINQESLRREFVIDPSQQVDVDFFAAGRAYKLFGLIPTDIHLVQPANPGSTTTMYLLGADQNGRDVFSRLIYGTRISMTIGLVGVVLSLFFGVLLGGISGYFSGGVDLVIQRIIEFIGALPTLPLWLGLAAALPPQWSGLRVYFGIAIILSFIGWTGLARVVRGRFLSLREEDFVTAARLDGAGELRIILRHMLPSFASHIIATLTLAIPGMILGETALSFLGLGLRAPIVSWGVLLEGANNVRAIATAPWMLSPALAVMVAVMALYFLGDGLRDAADPYAA
ncbi:MAG: ABC transporter permease [Chloroflexia bacterium]|nr:ABC transporter permease [Chloroflexia bacterium]